MPDKTGTALKKKGQTLVTAESCTGGWVAQAVTSIAGSSDWFERGYVTYSNAAKREALGVAEATLLRYGAVSEQTAREMARGALKSGAQARHDRARDHRHRRPGRRRAGQAGRHGLLCLGARA